MPRVLIVYYSRTGYTARIASQLATALQADVEPIVDLAPRTGLLGALRNTRDRIFRRPSPIKRASFSPSRYDLVIVGTPIRTRSLSGAVRSYLRTQRALLPRVAFFCTCADASVERVFHQMARECGQMPIAHLALTDTEVRTPALPIALARFVVHIKAALGPQRTWEGHEMRGSGRTRRGA